MGPSFTFFLLPPASSFNVISGMRNTRGHEPRCRRAVGYARVSTDKQAEHGSSLLAQAAKINAMVAVQDAVLLDIITDAGESAKSLERPGMARLLAMVDAG